jgi:hypothetical protein
MCLVDRGRASATEEAMYVTVWLIAIAVIVSESIKLFIGVVLLAS